MTDKWEQVGTLGVDAGLMYLGDPCYVMTQDCSDRFDGSWAQFCDLIGETEKDSVTLYKDGVGIMVSTGYGDGEYPVYVKRVDGRIKEVRVKFF